LEGLKALSAGGPQLLSSTWIDAGGEAHFPLATVLERDGIRLGVIGLSARPTAPETRDLVAWREPVEAARAALATLPEDLDLVVALSNLPEEERLAVSRGLPEIAAVLGTRGGEHNAPRMFRAATLIETPSRGRYVTVIRLRLGASAGAALLVEEAPVGLLKVWEDLRWNVSQRQIAPDDLEALSAMEERLAIMGAQLELAGRGLNLALVEDRPLGASLDAESEAGRLVEAFLGEVVQRATDTVSQADTQDPQTPLFSTASGCVSCHLSQFTQWTFHAHKEATQRLQVREKAQNPECLSCHSTAFGEPGGFGEPSQFNLSRFGGVQCEVCHGPLVGHPHHSEHAPLLPDEQTCLRCHDEANSPEFDYTSYRNRLSCIKSRL
jgi:hypothetical protein